MFLAIFKHIARNLEKQQKKLHANHATYVEGSYEQGYMKPS